MAIKYCVHRVPHSKSLRTFYMESHLFLSPPVSSITISLVLNANVSLCWACFDVSEGKYADDPELKANQHFVTQLQDHFFGWVDQCSNLTSLCQFLHHKNSRPSERWKMTTYLPTGTNSQVVLARTFAFQEMSGENELANKTVKWAHAATWYPLSFSRVSSVES